jgi:hypothetical protein
VTFRPDAANSTRPDEHQLALLLDGVDELVVDLRMGILDRSRPDGKRWSLTAEQLLSRARAHPRETVTTDRDAGVRGSGPPDPTMRQATTVDSAEMVALKELLAGVHTATHALGQAVKALDKATPEQQRPDRPDLNCCRVCSRPGKPEPIYASERCQWCWRFWRLWGVDVPGSILKLRREGRPISENVIRKVLDEELAG